MVSLTVMNSQLIFENFVDRYNSKKCKNNTRFFILQISFITKNTVGTYLQTQISSEIVTFLKVRKLVWCRYELFQ